MPFKSLTTALTHLSRRLFSAYPRAPQVDLSGKKIIVTGAAVGSIGYETAKTLAGWGATVIITTRKQPELIADRMLAELRQKGISARIEPAALDLTDAGSVNQFVKWYLSKHGDRLDVLVNNAGIHADLLNQWKQPQLSADGFEVHWRTNYLGPMQLTLQLLPLLKKTGKAFSDARVVIVSSHLHTNALNSDFFGATRPYNSWVAYGISKLALVHAAFEIQRRFSSNDNLQGVVLHPGSISTNIAHKGLAGSKVLQKLRDIFVRLEALVLLTPEQGAQTTILCASAPNIKGGVYYDRCEAGEVSEEAFDSGVAAKLWQQTEQWVNTVASAKEAEPA